MIDIDDNQKQLERAVSLIIDLTENHKDIDWNIWNGAFWTVLASGCVNSKKTYEFFCAELDTVKTHFKPWFKD